MCCVFVCVFIGVFVGVCVLRVCGMCVLCFVVVCCAVSLCVDVGAGVDVPCVCGVWCVVCGAAWHAENSLVCGFKTPPCVRRRAEIKIQTKKYNGKKFFFKKKGKSTRK